MPYDRNVPFNELPLLPPDKKVDEDVEILKKLVSTSRELAVDAYQHYFTSGSKNVNGYRKHLYH